MSSRHGSHALGSPISRQVKKHRRLDRFPFFNSVIRDLRERAPVFNLSVSHQLVRTSHPSGSRLWSDPNKEILSRPWQVNLPQKTVGTTPRPRFED